MPAVVRIDTGGTHGYQARIGGSVGYESKLFSDKKCGGKRKAKAAAIAWLEERGDRYAPRRFGPKKGVQVNNVSGTPGVHQSQLTRNGNVSRYWAAHYSIGPNGRRTHRSKRFYFGTKRTSDEARALAEEFRSGWVAAFEAEGVNGVKQFFNEWEGKYPSRKSRKAPASRKTATAKAGSAMTAVKDKLSAKVRGGEKSTRGGEKSTRGAKEKAQTAAPPKAATKSRAATKDAEKPKRGRKAKSEVAGANKAAADKPAAKSRAKAKAAPADAAEKTSSRATTKRGSKAKSDAKTKSASRAKPAAGDESDAKKSAGSKSSGRKSPTKKK